jgi:hypothetical protein
MNELAMASPEDVELFKQDVEAHIQHVLDNMHRLYSWERPFITNLCNHYEEMGWLSNKQYAYLACAWKQIVALTDPMLR